MRIPQIRIFAPLLFLILAQPLRATMLIIVYTPDGFWLAADSARETGGLRTATVCKVHETKWGLLLKGGNAQGTTYQGDHYSIDKEVEAALEKSTSVADFENNLRLQYKKDIDAELAFLVQDPAVTPDNLESIGFDTPIPADTVSTLIRTVLMVRPADVSPGEVLLVAPESPAISTDLMHRSKYRYWAPSIWGWHPTIDIRPEPGGLITFPGPARMFGELVTYSKPDTWVQAHPKEAIMEMLGLGHQQFPGTIGPPYVILHVIQAKGRKSKIHWIAKGVCPSWSEQVDPRSAQQELRDQPHTQ